MPAESPKTILLVEDQALISMAQQIELESYGYTVITANTGAKAVQISRTNPEIDLILMDINLGNGMNGIESAIQILNTRPLPVIFLSSHTVREAVALTHGLSIYGYILKGTNISALDESIKSGFCLFKTHIRRVAEMEHFATALNAACAGTLTRNKYSNQFCIARPPIPKGRPFFH